MKSSFTIIAINIIGALACGVAAVANALNERWELQQWPML